MDYPTLLYKKILQKIENDDIMRGKKKADVLEGDVECPDIVEFSVYDNKPVLFLSMAADKLVCNINVKEINENET